MFYYTNKRRRNKKIALIVGIVVLVAAVTVLTVVFFDDIIGLFKGTSPESPASQSPAVSTPTADPEPQKPIDESGMTVGTRFGVPEGFQRVTVEKGSFGEYLRNYALLPYGTAPRIFETGEDNTEAPTVGVLDQAVMSKNQQSADAIMRLYAEYLYEKKLYDQIQFDFFTTPVFKFEYAKWVDGQRVRTSEENAKKIEWYEDEGAKEGDTSLETFNAYLYQVMVHANSASLKEQMNSVDSSALQAGDAWFGGNHVILIVDVCVNPETGEQRFICAEGNAPATETYLLQDPDTGSVWMTLEEDGSFIKADVVYAANAVRRF